MQGRSARLQATCCLNSRSTIRRDAARALLAVDNAAVRPLRPAKLPNLLLRDPLVRNLRLDERRQLRKRFLPAEIAQLERNDFG